VALALSLGDHMPLAFFTVPVQSPESAAGELNGFLSSHKVLSEERRWVDLGLNSFWAICVDFLPVGVAGPGG
jgi:hypothetical protein